MPSDSTAIFQKEITITVFLKNAFKKCQIDKLFLLSKNLAKKGCNFAGKLKLKSKRQWKRFGRRSPMPKN
jgi:hypothetical protein